MKEVQLSELRMRSDDISRAIKTRGKEKTSAIFVAIFGILIVNTLLYDKIELGERLIGSILLFGFIYLIREVIEVQCRILGMELMLTMEPIEVHSENRDDLE